MKLIDGMYYRVKADCGTFLLLRYSEKTKRLHSDYENMSTDIKIDSENPIDPAFKLGNRI